MKKQIQTDQDRRGSDRIVDGSVVLVSGRDRLSHPFSEVTRIQDISQNGVSFLLKTPVEVSSRVALSICCPHDSRGEIAPTFGVRATIVRTSNSDSEPRLVAARFEGDFIQFRKFFEKEAIVQALEEAVSYDEGRRVRA